MTLSVSRLEDMSVGGRLTLIKQDDGDIIVAVQSYENGLVQPGDSVEFCGGFGGGKSPKTMAALRELFKAMQEDNEQFPMRSVEAYEKRLNEKGEYQ